MNIGPTEALLVALVALPVLVLPLLVVFWAFRLGKRQGAAEARERMSQESPPNG
jgi:cbb3-type cytochrome oxidase subunit 3